MDLQLGFWVGMGGCSVGCRWMWVEVVDILNENGWWVQGPVRMAMSREMV